MNQERNRISKLKKLKYKFGIGISVLFTVIIVLITSMVVIETNRLLTGKVLSLAYDLNSQTRANLDAYVEFFENTSLYLYSHEDYVDYSPIDSELSDYHTVELENHISSFLYDICILGDYADFIVAYSDGHVLGKLSEDTRILFDNNMYMEAVSVLENNGEKTAWITGYNDNFNRIYFVRRLNENAVFMSSTYTSSLGAVIENADSENFMSSRILNERGQVIYDRDMNLVGETVFENFTNISNIDEDTLTTVAECENGWKVVGTANTGDILKERTQAVTFVILIALVAIMIAVVASIGFTFRMIVPEERLLNKLYEKSIKDQMTGLFDRSSFTDEARALLNNTIDEKGNGNAALVYLDIDSMKHLNYRRGHAYGDEVIIALSDAIRKVFGHDSVAGRVDGEEFAILVPLLENDKEQRMKVIEDKCKALNDALHHYMGNNDDKSIAVSIGVCMAPDYGKELGLLYDLAERAMYAAKRDESSEYHFYDYTKDYNTWTGNNR